MEDAEVVVVPYDPDWPRRFEAERALLSTSLAHGYRVASTTSARRQFPASPPSPSSTSWPASATSKALARLSSRCVSSVPPRPSPRGYRTPFCQAVATTIDARPAPHPTGERSLARAARLPRRTPERSGASRRIRDAEATARTGGIATMDRHTPGTSAPSSPACLPAPAYRSASHRLSSRAATDTLVDSLATQLKSAAIRHNLGTL